MKITRDEALANPILKAALEGAPKAAQPAVLGAKAKGRTRKVPGQMNKLEQAYARHLEGEKQAGRVLEFYYEPMGLKIAPKTFWHPDFLVLTAGHFIELHECKGFMEDHANVKIKAVAAMFWWLTVKLVRRKPAREGSGFDVREVG